MQHNCKRSILLTQASTVEEQTSTKLLSNFESGVGCLCVCGRLFRADSLSFTAPTWAETLHSVASHWMVYASFSTQHQLTIKKSIGAHERIWIGLYKCEDYIAS
jgi:hypothetical protein